MAQQIILFEKNRGDFSETDVVATASQGVGFETFAINRSNLSAWVTTGSVDADNTTFELDFGDLRDIDNIILVLHNFKNYTIQYWNGSAWTNFSTSISVTNNTSDTTRHSFTLVETTKVKLTVTGTMVANADKYLHQFICTKLIGQLNGWPIIKNAIRGRNKQRTKMLSGKESVREQIGFFSCTLEIAVTSDEEDLDLVEDLQDSNDGFLLWLCGGSESQFSSARQGYRLEDIPLVKCANEYKPNFYKGIYSLGLPVTLDLVEVVD